MALLQKNPHVDRLRQQLFNIGTTRSLLVVGLGNIGKNYVNTRHNIGFKCLDDFTTKHDFGKWTIKKDLDSLVNINILGDIRVIMIKPTTMMNLSGKAVQKVVNYYKIQQRDIVVIHDELAIPFGQIRTRVGGTDAGHNGVKSLIAFIGEDFGRIRIGINGSKPDNMDSKDFVLSKFTLSEKKTATKSC